MRFSVAVIAVFAGIAAAQKAGKGKSSGGGGGGSNVKNELLEGACKKITLIFARASTEPGNMGNSRGAATCSGLKKAYNNDVACQGVGKTTGKGYPAGLAENFVPKAMPAGYSSHIGTLQSAVDEAKKMFETAFTKCPQSIVVAGGYSQGTAVMNNTISQMSASDKAKVTGVVLFGYTRFGQAKQDKTSPAGQKFIHNFPDSKVMVLCSAKDGVCDGQLNVNAGHFSYMADGSGPKAVAFLKARIDGAKGDSASPAEAEPEMAEE